MAIWGYSGITHSQAHPYEHVERLLRYHQFFHVFPVYKHLPTLLSQQKARSQPQMKRPAATSKDTSIINPTELYQVSLVMYYHYSNVYQLTATSSSRVQVSAAPLECHVAPDGAVPADVAVATAGPGASGVVDAAGGAEDLPGQWPGGGPW